jgi:hypothetical protein
MSTPQTIARVAPRFQVRQAPLLTALGVFVAIAVSIVILALTGASHTTAASPVTASEATGASVPQVHYLGPRQLSEGLNPQTTQMPRGGTSSTNNALSGYACLGAAQHCLPVRKGR